MPAVIAMLRAVNVGGNHKIKMEELRALCTGLKLGDPETYVQSGNIVFTTPEKDLVKLAKRLEDAIEKKCGFRPDVILRTADELAKVIARNPFAGRDGIEPGKLIVMFLARDPGGAARAAVLKVKTDVEELVAEGSELFIYFPNGQGKTKMSWAQVNRALGVAGTGRNWNSVTKMLEMAHGKNAKAR